MITIVFWLWKSLTFKHRHDYIPERVNIAARMVERNVTIPHRFVCITDWPKDGFDPIISKIPLWNDWRELKNPKWHDGKPHCYVRLKLFSEEMRQLIGDRFVSMDLDCLILDSLDPIFSRTEDFLIFHRFIDSQRSRIVNNPYNGSMWMMNAGVRPQVWTDFKGLESVLAANGHIGTDQAWITHKLGPNEAGWGIKDGVFGWPNIQADGRYEQKPPIEARLIFFYGDDKPWHYLPKSAPVLKPGERERRRHKEHLYGRRFEWIAKYYW